MLKSLFTETMHTWITVNMEASTNYIIKPFKIETVQSSLKVRYFFFHCI